MNKADLVAAVAAQADLTKDKADAAVSAIVEQITNALSRDESVTLIGLAHSAKAIALPALAATHKRVQKSRSLPLTALTLKLVRR